MIIHWTISFGLYLLLLTFSNIRCEVESVPDAPQNVTVVNVTSSTATISWLPPANPNGVIAGYRIYSTTGNLTNATWLKQPAALMMYTLTELEPNADYTVEVKAFTEGYEGRESARARLRTDVAAPAEPRLLALECRPGAGLLVTWERPTDPRRAVDLYLLQYRAGADHHFRELQLDARAGTEPHYQYVLSNLSVASEYEVRVRAAARSRLDPTVLRYSPVSPSRRAVALTVCPPPGATGWRSRDHEPRASVTTPASHDATPQHGVGVGVVAGCICAALALLLAMVALLLWRRVFKSPYRTLEQRPVLVRTPLTADPEWVTDGPNGHVAPIVADAFPLHVATLHADSDIGFCKEYDEIQEHTMKLGLPSETSQVEENKKKNRYQNIDAYDHSLVPLRPLSGQRRGDYINANYIDGYLVHNQYIGAQGPLPNTFAAFWRLIWEQRITVLVMITNLVERSRRKCDMYWPKEGSETYGQVQVELIDERELATYTVRKLRVTRAGQRKRRRKGGLGGGGERTVYQYHYTNWPDHGVPEHPLPILSFVRKSAAANAPSSGPILVHCSAGVGRTGTYIVLDAMMAMLKHRGTVNVFGFLKHIRTQRNFLVQTEDQYVFIHDALLEALDAGDTDVPAGRLSAYLRRLRTADVGVYPCHTLDRQYQLITAHRPEEYELAAAVAPFNQHKNRSGQFVPPEKWRVHLAPRPGVEGSDYVNATMLLGYERLREFIISQHPLSETVEDFWRMVWDHNVQTIVLLSPNDEQEYPQFWPGVHDDIDSDSFRVRAEPPSSGEDRPDGTVDLLLMSTQDDYQVSVRLLRCPGWPQPTQAEQPPPQQFIETVQQATLKYQDGPLLVVDRYGGTEAATFCCLTTFAKQLQQEGSADVYMYAKLYHMRRPGVWQTQDDFVWLYSAAEAMSQPVRSPTPSSRSRSEAEALLRPSALQRERNGAPRAPPDGREVAHGDCV